MRTIRSWKNSMDFMAVWLLYGFIFTHVLLATTFLYLLLLISLPHYRYASAGQQTGISSICKFAFRNTLKHVSEITNYPEI